MSEKFELGFRGQQQIFLEILISLKGVEMKLKTIKKKMQSIQRYSFSQN